MALAQLTVMVSALVGWSDIDIQPSRPERATASYRSAANLERPTERTLETLKRYDLERVYRHDVNNTLMRIERFAQKQPTAELVYALAELSWIEGQRLDRWRKPQALDRYLDAAAYSFDFLFDPELAAGRAPADPRYRQAMDLYNAALDHLIRAAMIKRQIRPQKGEDIPFKFHGRDEKLRFVIDEESPWKSADVTKLLLSSDFEVTGLDKEREQYGLGVPLIGVRETPAKPEDRSPQEQFYPAEMAFPLTAFLVPNSRLRDPNLDVEKARVCTLLLIDPVKHQTWETKGNVLALEIDLTTPLAYMWSRTDLDRFRWSGLLRPEKGLERANLILIRPYEPGKIPVVMVHGLISTPLAWIPMLNELLRKPEIQNRYQFFLYMYPTGVPIPIAAASLRKSLYDAKKLYDTNGQDPAFDQMVLLGHSMGGLLSHMMAVSSGDKLWRLYSDRAFDTEIIGPRDVLDELRTYLFFEPVPFVKRVVFLATPHRGSDMARGMVGRVGTSLISDPDNIHDLLKRLMKDNQDAFDTKRFGRFPTSIETLTTNSPILMALERMQPGPEIVFHSIIGSKSATGVAETSDGVVPYSSSHLVGVGEKNVRSEKMVRSDHSVQDHSLAIIEVERILQEHVGVIPTEPSPRQAPGTGRPDQQAQIGTQPTRR
jgi:pimeloyl-ACP methyl ester carboxylesterase